MIGPSIRRVRQRPDQREGGGDIKHVHQVPTVDNRVGVTVHVDIELVVVVEDEKHGEANITDSHATVIDLLGVRVSDLKHVARAIGVMRTDTGAVLCQTSQDAPQKYIRRSVDTVDETDVIAARRDGDAEREG